MNASLKKALCVGFAALMVTSTVTAAPKKKAKGGKDPYKGIEKQKDPATKKVYDFKGLNVVIGDWWSNKDNPPASKADEDLYAWRQWSNSTYNMNVVVDGVTSWGGNPQFVTNYCITGDDSDETKYVFTIDGRSALTGVRANLFYDLSKIKSVDYHNDKVYEQGTVAKLQKGSSFYAFNFGKPEPKCGMFFNKRILQENGIDPELPYDMQKDGTWTWDSFEELCKKLTRDTDNDGVIDQYAMASFNSEFSYIALDSNNAFLIGRDDNGKYYNAAGSDNAMEAWNWIQYMFATYQLPQPEGGNWDYFYTAFINGECAFLADHEYNAQLNGKFSEMADDFGFVCFPLGPHGPKTYRTQHDNNMIVMPSCYSAETAEKVAKAIDLFAQPTPGYDGPDSWKESYYACFRDSRAVDETLVLMAATPNPRFDTLISGLSQGDMVWGITGGWLSPQEAYEGAKNVWQGLIDDCNR